MHLWALRHHYPQKHLRFHSEGWWSHASILLSLAFESLFGARYHGMRVYITCEIERYGRPNRRCKLVSARVLYDPGAVKMHARILGCHCHILGEDQHREDRDEQKLSQHDSTEQNLFRLSHRDFVFGKSRPAEFHSMLCSGELHTRRWSWLWLSTVSSITSLEWILGGFDRRDQLPKQQPDNVCYRNILQSRSIREHDVNNWTQFIVPDIQCQSEEGKSIGQSVLNLFPNGAEPKTHVVLGFVSPKLRRCIMMGRIRIKSSRQIQLQGGCHDAANESERATVWAVMRWFVTADAICNNSGSNEQILYQCRRTKWVRSVIEHKIENRLRNRIWLQTTGRYCMIRKDRLHVDTRPLWSTQNE